MSLSIDSPSKVQKNTSYSGSPSMNKEEKNGDSKTPTRNRSLNSLLSPLLSSFRKNGNGNNKNGEKSPEKKEKNGDSKKNDKDPKKDQKTQEIVLTKTPNSDQLNSMDLKEGENVIKFIAKQSKQVAEAKLYFWSHDSKVIVSDIDGTITKYEISVGGILCPNQFYRTDKRGLFLYKFGYDWTHEKVVDLYKCLSTAGYKFVYLTARTVKGVSHRKF